LIGTIDFQKAFDKISHSSLKQIIRHLNLPPLITEALCASLDDRTARVQVNGFLSAKFPITSGVPQGDPLSPILFDINIELLSKFIVNSRAIVGIDVCSITIKIALFADDLAFFANDTFDMKRFWDAIQLYCEATSSRVNISKCYFIIPEGSTPSINSQLPFNLIKPAGEKYLGVLINNDGQIDNSSTRIDSLCNSLIANQPLFLSFKGKINLIKSYILSRLNHTLPYLTISSIDLKRFINHLNWFLFHSNYPFDSKKSYKSNINSSRLSLPHHLGGVSLPNIQALIDASRALLFRSIFSDANPKPMWKRVWKIYFSSLSLLYPSYYSTSDINWKKIKQVPHLITPPYFNESISAWISLNSCLNNPNFLLINSITAKSDRKKELPRKIIACILTLNSLSKSKVKTFQSSQLLTKAQSVLSESNGINFSRSWLRCSRLKVRAALSSFCFKLIHNSIPAFVQECQCGTLKPTKYSHVLDCSKLISYKHQIYSTLSKITGHHINWSLSSTFSLSSDKNYNNILVIAHWTLWRVYTSMNHSKIELSSEQTDAICCAELQNLLNSEYHKSPSNFYKNNSYSIWS
jgi:hypothetical protein